ncbi:protein of unknown function [uncultured Sphingopyxis sp.]|uniref:Uncharacterized protein n=1 Tax=uncultured Sphingopyxis sp. TaxID=310581 RepID=A0A1Y5PVI6_9SPHN|nr:protein of unknown function [uncultured Sphingopyxis sp.]
MLIKKHAPMPNGDYAPVTGAHPEISFGVVRNPAPDGLVMTAERAVFRRLYPVAKPADPTASWDWTHRPSAGPMMRRPSGRFATSLRTLPCGSPKPISSRRLCGWRRCGRLAGATSSTWRKSIRRRSSSASTSQGGRLVRACLTCTDWL